jgi:hypothetical protein
MVWSRTPRQYNVSTSRVARKPMGRTICTDVFRRRGQQQRRRLLPCGTEIPRHVTTPTARDDTTARSLEGPAETAQSRPLALADAPTAQWPTPSSMRAPGR